MIASSQPRPQGSFLQKLLTALSAHYLINANIIPEKVLDMTSIIINYFANLQLIRKASISIFLMLITTILHAEVYVFIDHKELGKIIVAPENATENYDWSSKFFIDMEGHWLNSYKVRTSSNIFTNSYENLSKVREIKNTKTESGWDYEVTLRDGTVIADSSSLGFGIVNVNSKPGNSKFISSMDGEIFPLDFPTSLTPGDLISNSKYAGFPVKHSVKIMIKQGKEFPWNSMKFLTKEEAYSILDKNEFPSDYARNYYLKIYNRDAKDVFGPTPNLSKIKAFAAKRIESEATSYKDVDFAGLAPNAAQLASAIERQEDAIAQKNQDAQSRRLAIADKEKRSRGAQICTIRHAKVPSAASIAFNTNNYFEPANALIIGFNEEVIGKRVRIRIGSIEAVTKSGRNYIDRLDGRPVFQVGGIIWDDIEYWSMCDLVSVTPPNP